MENTNLMVTIPIFRYEQLLDTETRVDVAVERMTNDEYCRIEDILRILGTELALQKADEIREADRKRDEEYRRKYEEREEFNNADN